MINKQTAKTALAKTLVFILFMVRPIFGPAYCYFSLSCTLFAQQQLETKPLHKALATIVKRLMLCNPLYPMLLRHGFVKI